MDTNTILVAIVALLLGGIGGYMLSGQTGKGWGPGMMVQNEIGEVAPMGSHRMENETMFGGGGIMTGMHGMENMMAMMVTSERAFIEGMIPHHQEAVDTAKEVLERGGTTKEIRTLAEGIVSSQEQEIADMKQWHESWYGEAYVDSDDYVPMMRDLGQLRGVELDRTFLEDMVMHHMGAIMMARSAQPYLEHDVARDLARSIIENQSREIKLMQLLYTEL